MTLRQYAFIVFFIVLFSFSPSVISADTINKTIDSFPYSQHFDLIYGDEYIYELHIKPGQQVNVSAQFGQLYTDNQIIHKTKNIIPTINHLGSIYFSVDEKQPKLINGAFFSFLTRGGFESDDTESNRFTNTWHWEWEKDPYPAQSLSYLSASKLSNSDNKFYLMMSNSNNNFNNSSYAVRANLPTELIISLKDFFDANSSTDACNDEKCALEIKPGKFMGYLSPREDGSMTKYTQRRSEDVKDVYKLAVKDKDIIDFSVSSDREIAVSITGVKCEESCQKDWGKTHHIKGIVDNKKNVFITVSAVPQHPENATILTYSFNVQKNPGILSFIQWDRCQLPNFFQKIFKISCSQNRAITSSPMLESQNSKNDVCQGSFNEDAQISIADSAKYLGDLLAKGKDGYYNKFKCQTPYHPLIPLKAREMYTKSTSWDPDKSPDEYVQCVTFVFMAYNMARQPITKLSTTNGKNFADEKYTGPNGQFIKYENGQTDVLPQLGDILVWTDGDYGHVGIVSVIDSYHIKMFNANTPNLYYRFAYIAKNQKLFLISDSTDITRSAPKYWLHKKQ